MHRKSETGNWAHELSTGHRNKIYILSENKDPMLLVPQNWDYPPSARINLIIHSPFPDPSSPSINFPTVPTISQKWCFPFYSRSLCRYLVPCLSLIWQPVWLQCQHTQQHLETKRCCLSSLNHCQRTTTLKNSNRGGDTACDVLQERYRVNSAFGSTLWGSSKLMPLFDLLILPVRHCRGG